MLNSLDLKFGQVRYKGTLEPNTNDIAQINDTYRTGVNLDANLELSSR